MRLTDTLNKIKSHLAHIAHSPDLPKDVFVALLILLIGIGGFMLGRLSANESFRKNELSVIGGGVASAAVFEVIPAGNEPQITAPKPALSGTAMVAGMYVGSKSGKTYHLPWCSGAKRIKEENKIWFESKEEAQGRGYTPAVNCKGI